MEVGNKEPVVARKMLRPCIFRQRCMFDRKCPFLCCSLAHLTRLGLFNVSCLLNHDSYRAAFTLQSNISSRSNLVPPPQSGQRTQRRKITHNLIHPEGMCRRGGCGGCWRCVGVSLGATLRVYYIHHSVCIMSIYTYIMQTEIGVTPSDTT
jgi:hypothetical protein